MDVSVCIPTRNRPDDLVACIGSIVMSSIGVSQIVVADDSTDDRTRDLIESRCSFVTYVPGPRQGLGANRNAAIDAATGDWVLFLDDDARLGADFLTVMAKMAAAQGGRKAVFSGVEQQETGLVFPRDQDFLGFQTRQYRPDDALNTLVINATLFPTALLRALRFDRHLVYGYDEVDIASRARAAGYEIVFCPGAVNRHYPSPVNRDYYRPHTESARIYVTFKKYVAVERNFLKAAAFLGVTLLHTMIHSARRAGVAGLLDAIRVHRNAWRQIGRWRTETRALQRQERSSGAGMIVGRQPE
jgi:GT2 family glycosyltransferase